MKTAKLGSISHGTLIPRDLIQAFSDCLRSHVEGNEYATLLRECAAWLIASDDEEDEQRRNVSDELVSELTDALQEASSEYAHFSHLDGDGSDFGFWPDIAQLEEDVECGDVIKADAGSEPEFMMSVNDRGNVTLYRIKLEEVWATV